MKQDDFERVQEFDKERQERIEKLEARIAKLEAAFKVIQVGDIPCPDFKVDTLEMAHLMGWEMALLKCGEILSVALTPDHIPDITKKVCELCKGSKEFVRMGEPCPKCGKGKDGT